MNHRAGSCVNAPLYGLTGLYCAGKNHIARELEKRGFAVLDVDKLGWQALDTAREDIRQRWGDAIAPPGGAVDRTALGKRVFANPEELAALEAIVHPLVNKLLAAWVAEQSSRPRIINAALLHKTAVFENLDGIILVEAPWIIRLIRARMRDKLQFGQIIRRFTSQNTFLTQYLAKKTDTYRIENKGFAFFSRIFRRDLEKKLDALLRHLMIPAAHNDNICHKAGN